MVTGLEGTTTGVVLAGGLGGAISFLGGSGDSPGGVVCGVGLLAAGSTTGEAAGASIRSGAAFAKISFT